MTNFTRYPSYKDSGIEWLGKIPAHWQMKKVKFLAKIQKIKSFDKNPVILSLARDKIKVRDISTGEGQIAATYNGYHRVQIGDFLLNPMDLYSGANCNISHVNGVISPAYTNLKFNQKINTNFADFFFKIMYENLFLKSIGKGVSDENRWTLNNETLMNIKIPLPPKDEQTKIASFLDEKTSQINQAIAQKERLVELLKEKKQITINDAVTKGLDKNTPLKDSGVEWLGKIPAHWESISIKRLITLLTDYTANGSFADLAKNVQYLNEPDYARLIRLTDIRNGFKEKGVYINEKSYKYLKKSSLFGGELLMANVGAYSGYSFLLPKKLDFNASLAPNMFLIKFDTKQVDNQFIYYALNCNTVLSRLVLIATSTAQPKLNKDDVKSIFLPLPPKDEQTKIASFLDKKTTQIDKAIQLQQNYIAKLKEYKASLIDSVVRGKVRVG